MEMSIDLPIITNILFENSAVISLRDYINPETLAIGYDYKTSTVDEMMQCFFSASNNNNINRIGFAFHYSDPSLSLFLNQEPFFTDSDLGESVEIYSRNFQFMLDLLLIGGITHVDFLACNTLQNDKWKQYYQLLQTKTGVIIGASENNTGNLLYGGDWIMESTHEEVGLIYFTAEIENWASLLTLPTGLNTYYHTFYTVQNGGTVMTRTIYNNAGTTILDTRDISFGGMLIIDVFSLMDGGGTNPYTIGIVDSSLNKICMDIASCGIYTKSLTDRQKTVLTNDVNTKYKEPHTAAASTFVVTVSGGVYWVSTNGANAVSAPKLTLTIGNLYVFDQSHSSNAGKPLRLSTAVDGPTAYTTGVVTNGTPGSLNGNAYTLIDVTATTTLPLHYFCTTTASMGYALSTLPDFYGVSYGSYNAANYNATSKTFTDQSTNARDISFSSGLPSILTNAINTNGSSKSFVVVNGVGSDRCTIVPSWSSMANSSLYTIIVVSRRISISTSYGRGTIFGSRNYDLILGYWDYGTDRKCYNIYTGWNTGGANYSTNFWICSMQNNQVRGNGTATNIKSPYIAFPSDGFYICPNIEGNPGIPFEIAEILIFDTKLSSSNLTKVESLLITKYGI